MVPPRSSIRASKQMKNFPFQTGLTIAIVAVLLAGVRLLVPSAQGLHWAHLSAIIDLRGDRVTLSPLIRHSDPILPIPAPARLGKSPFLLDDSRGQLDHFYKALWRSEKRENGAVTRIVHYGDSPTTSDLITGDVRELLQRRFGDAGHGFVLVDKPWAWYQHVGVKLFASGWLIAPASHFEAQDGMFGLGGVTFSGSAPARSTIIFERRRYSQFEVWYLRQPSGGVLTVSADGQLLGHVDTRGDSKSPGFAPFRVESGASGLNIQVDQGSVRLFGITAEKAGPGIVYDSLGLNGGSIEVLSHMFNPTHWAEELRHRRPDLIIVNYGTNEAGFGSFLDSEYERELREVIRRIRGAVPDSSILVMSPLDRGRRTPSGEIETMPTIPRIVSIQRRVASETGCGFFDTFEAMGGAGTIGRWYAAEPRLIAADLIHPYGNAGKMIAGVFTKEIVAGLNRFKRRESISDPPEGVRQ